MLTRSQARKVDIGRRSKVSGPTDRYEMPLTRSQTRKKKAESEDLEARVVEAHQAIQKVWPSDSPNVAPLEPVDCCLLAHQYYSLWEPSPSSCHDRPVNLLLMAESHAATAQSLVGAQINEKFKADVPHLGHLNVVHCLSYGESWLLEQIPKNLSKSALRGILMGTRQFWKLLAALSGDLDVKDNGYDPLQSEETFKSAFRHIEGTEPQFREKRLQAKLSIREGLKKRGILLVDCSATPIYAGGGTKKYTNKKTGKEYTSRENKLPEKDVHKVIRAAWNCYSKYLLRRYRPREFLLLGLRIEKAIGKDAIQQEAVDCGSNYLGARHHPSWNKILGSKFLPKLREYRALGKQCEYMAEKRKSKV